MVIQIEHITISLYNLTGIKTLRRAFLCLVSRRPFSLYYHRDIMGRLLFGTINTYWFHFHTPLTQDHEIRLIIFILKQRKLPYCDLDS